MKTFFIKTLGCKVNQFESDGISLGLEKKGWARSKTSLNADVVIINTCGVTGKAGMQSRQAIRKLARDNPRATILVTGCHAQTDPDQIRSIKEVDQIIGNTDKSSIADRITDICASETPLPFSHPSRGKTNRFLDFETTVKGRMTRAYLKIQDGCNAFCSYCIVPYARGSSVSMPEETVFRHLQNLCQDGYKEVILTGIHIGMYGLEMAPRSSLLALLEKINRDRPVHRIRLSSIEPGEISTGIIQLARPGNILCDHFHIPLQSGDDEILKQMRRPYDRALFSEIVHKISHELPHACIGVDTLIGFPGETDHQFDNTYKLIEQLPIAYLHVFPFSARKKTAAYHYTPKVDSDRIKERCARMRELGQQKRQAFIMANMGRRLEAVVQHAPATRSGHVKAVTRNYLTILLKKKEALPGTVIHVVPKQCDKTQVIFGRCADSSDPA